VLARALVSPSQRPFELTQTAGDIIGIGIASGPTLRSASGAHQPRDYNTRVSVSRGSYACFSREIGRPPRAVEPLQQPGAQAAPRRARRSASAQPEQAAPLRRRKRASASRQPATVRSGARSRARGRRPHVRRIATGMRAAPPPADPGDIVGQPLSGTQPSSTTCSERRFSGRRARRGSPGGAPPQRLEARPVDGGSRRARCWPQAAHRVPDTPAPPPESPLEPISRSPSSPSAGRAGARSRTTSSSVRQELDRRRVRPRGTGPPRRWQSPNPSAAPPHRWESAPAATRSGDERSVPRPDQESSSSPESAK